MQKPQKTKRKKVYSSRNIFAKIVIAVLEFFIIKGCYHEQLSDLQNI